MADPTTPVPSTTATDITGVADASQQAATDLQNMTNVIVQSQDSFVGLGQSMQGVNNMFNQMGSSLRGFGVSLNDIKSLTTQQRDQLTLVSAAVIGARDSFISLNNVDTTGLSTFTGQITELMTTLKNEGPATSAVAAGLYDLAKKAGASESALAQAAATGVSGLGKLAQSMLTSADNGLRLQNAIIQLSARTGSLGEVFDMAGPHLDNMNALLSKHQQIITDAGKATGVPTAQIERYYAQLGSVPRAMSSLVKGSGDADTAVSMLTATMKVATGTGRTYEDVVDDLKVAFKNYGVVGEDALKFSTQMSEVSQHLGVELDTVKRALQGTSDTFKMFAGTQQEAARMSSEFADIMNKYAGSLEKTGLSGTQAVDVVKNMTGQLANLSIAQKSFLSAQTGGAGGLMGAFQIDKMIREGRISEVFEKVRQQMTKQFGSIVTLDQAAQSQGAAAQMTRQMMLLRQGPLGQFARTDVEAQRILEGFKGMETGGTTAQGLSDRIVQESMDKGTDIQSKSFSVISEINQDVAAIRGMMNTSGLGMVQKGLTAGTGTGEHGAAREIATNLKSSMDRATNMQNDRIRDSLAMDTQNKKLNDTSGRAAASAITDLQNTFSSSNMKAALSQPLDVLKKTLTNPTPAPGGVEDAQKARNDLKNQIDQMKKDMSKTPIDQRGKSAADLLKAEDVLGKIDAARPAFASNNTTEIMPLSEAMRIRNARPAGAQVGSAANRAVANRNVATPEGTTSPSGIQVPAPPVDNGEITVHVTGFCLKCKQEIEGGSQAKAVNKASTNI